MNTEKPSDPLYDEPMTNKNIVAWLRNERGNAQGKATLDPLVLLGSEPPPASLYHASYSPVVPANLTPEVHAYFECESNGIVGRGSAPIKRVSQNDDGSISVTIGFWPQITTAPVNATPPDGKTVELLAHRMASRYQAGVNGESSQYTFNSLTLSLFVQRLFDEQAKSHSEDKRYYRVLPQTLRQHAEDLGTHDKNLDQTASMLLQASEAIDQQQRIIDGLDSSDEKLARHMSQHFASSLLSAIYKANERVGIATPQPPSQMPLSYFLESIKNLADIAVQNNPSGAKND